MLKRVVFIIAAVLFLAGILLFWRLKGRIQRPYYAQQKPVLTQYSALLNQARQLEAKNELVRAVCVYQRLLKEFPASAEVANWQKKIEEINIRLLFSPTITAKSKPYEIKPGDTLAKLASQFNTTVELLMKSNNLSSDRIIPGRRLKVWTEPFVIFVDKSQNILILKTKDEEVIKTYTVSTGVNNSTPVGTFRISEKIPNPPWFRPGRQEPIPAGDPENILGTRWLGLNLPGYGIHGTIEPQSLGKQVTQGCVRMANADVEELYIIVPKGSEVIIVD
jgi:lipoprotein-anchoring transpeptidase ErfK/SrfK